MRTLQKRKIVNEIMMQLFFFIKVVVFAWKYWNYPLDNVFDLILYQLD